MPLKERGGELLRELININYKLINSHFITEFTTINNSHALEKVMVIPVWKA